eukprot:COSAG05_NODE_7660_length_782_cov_22.343927_1_plen_148_part_10
MSSSSVPTTAFAAAAAIAAALGCRGDEANTATAEPAVGGGEGSRSAHGTERLGADVEAVLERGLEAFDTLLASAPRRHRRAISQAQAHTEEMLDGLGAPPAVTGAGEGELVGSLRAVQAAAAAAANPSVPLASRSQELIEAMEALLKH